MPAQRQLNERANERAMGDFSPLDSGRCQLSAAGLLSEEAYVDKSL
jgi:hypothetical protein